MPAFRKNAAIKAKSLKHLADILTGTGRRFAAGSGAKAAKGFVGGEGSSSLIFDGITSIPSWILRGKSKINPGSTVGKDISNRLRGGINKIKETIGDADIRAGSAISDKLKNTRLKNLFVENQSFKTLGLDGRPDLNIEVGIPSLSAPLNKTKKFALPTIGALTVANYLRGKENKNEEENTAPEGGEAMERAALSKEELIGKIAEAISGGDNRIVINTRGSQSARKIAKVAEEAVSLLKIASEELEDLKVQVEKLAESNRKYELQLMAKARSSRAVKLASRMNNFGLVKTAELDKKIDEIMDMDDDAFEILAETVKTMGLTKKSSTEEGIDSLQYIASQQDAQGKLRRSLADLIDSEVRGY